MYSTIKKDYLSVILISLILLTFPVKGFSMGLFDFLKVYQASEFNGVLVKGGVPIAGVTLQRKVDENDSYVTTQETVTDEQGKFYFPSVYRYGLARFSLAEDRYFQTITFDYNGKDFRAIYIAKAGSLLNDEISFLEGRKTINLPLNFICDVETSDEYSKYRNSSFLGICRFIE